jgi:flagellar basal-body rod protein FlgB
VRAGTGIAKCSGMIDPIFQSDNYQLARKLLDGAVLRQEAIASNIANAETPGYRRLDVSGDFASELRARLGQAGSVRSFSGIEPTLVEDLNARSVRPDGNSVEIERELLEMNRNTVEYDFLADVVSRNIKQLRMAITGRTGA